MAIHHDAPPPEVQIRVLQRELDRLGLRPLAGKLLDTDFDVFERAMALTALADRLRVTMETVLALRRLVLSLQQTGAHAALGELIEFLTQPGHAFPEERKFLQASRDYTFIMPMMSRTLALLRFVHECNETLLERYLATRKPVSAAAEFSKLPGAKAVTELFMKYPGLPARVRERLADPTIRGKYEGEDILKVHAQYFSSLPDMYGAVPIPLSWGGWCDCRFIGGSVRGEFEHEGRYVPYGNQLLFYAATRAYHVLADWSEEERQDAGIWEFNLDFALRPPVMIGIHEEAQQESVAAAYPGRTAFDYQHRYGAVILLTLPEVAAYEAYTQGIPIPGRGRRYLFQGSNR